MTSRREPLLWLQCLAIGVIPLELLLIRMVLAAADPGPIPPLERLFTWGVGVLAPTLALWKRPADWASLLILRLPISNRSLEQQQLSSRQRGFSSNAAFALGAAALLPVIWFLDDSAGLIHELSPVQGSSRLVTLMLCIPLLALIVWQVQQLVQAVILLSSKKEIQTLEPLNSEQLHEERTSFGLQVLRLAPLEWPQAAEQLSIRTNDSEPDQSEQTGQIEDSEQPEEQEQTEVQEQPKEQEQPEEQEQPKERVSKAEITAPTEQIDTTHSVAASVAVEPEQASEENQSASLDADIGEIEGNTSGSPEKHGEEPEPSGGEQSEPEDTSEPTPGSL